MLKIGSLEVENGLVLAPMAGYTNLGFRLTISVVTRPAPSFLIVSLNPRFVYPAMGARIRPFFIIKEPIFSMSEF